MRNEKEVVEVMIVVIIVGILSALLLLAIFTPNGIMPGYSNGERSGIVNKLSEKGIFWKSWEGELLMQTANTAAVAPEKFVFSVSHEAVPEVQSALKSGAIVTLVYSQYLFKPWKIDSGYLIVAVKK